MSRHKVLTWVSFAASASLLVLSASLVHASDRAIPDAEDGWGSWTALGKGYIARRKEPPRVKQLEAEERKLARLGMRHSIDKGKESSSTLQATKSQTSVIEQAKDNSGTAMWLRTRDEGLYAVSMDDLAAVLGQSANSLRKKAQKGDFSLANAGEPAPLYFDEEQDALLFVGEANDTFYTDENVYKFTEDRKNATPMAVSDGSAIIALGEQASFRDTLKFEEEPDLYFVTYPVADDPDADYWFWDRLFGGYKDLIEVELEIPNPALTGTAQIRIMLRGSTDMYAGDDHYVYAELNGVEIGQPLVWDGFEERPLVADIDQGLLNPDGSNTLRLRNVYSPGEHPMQWLDEIELSYQRMPIADNGTLWLHNSAGGVQTVSGFSAADILVIESPDEVPVLRKDILVEADGDSWAVNFEANPGLDYLVVEAGDFQTPVPAFVPKFRLKDPKNRADYMIIASREFEGTAEKLSKYRKKRFKNINIVWLDEIYAEFSDGKVDPAAVTRFMEWTKNWRVSPSYVMLLGKGTIDHKDRMGYGDSFVPIAMTSTPWALAASDQRLLAGDGDASFSIGRLPMTEDEEGLAYVEKLIKHESTIPGSEHYEAVLAADNPDAAGDFHSNTVALSDRLLGTGEFDVVNMLLHPDDAVRTSLIDSDTWETGYVSYDGHGSTSQVGNYSEEFINSDDAELLQNFSYPVFTALTCASGDYSYPGMRSLASALVLNPSGGAIASFAPTGLSLDADAQLLGNAFVDHLYVSKSTIGDAVRDAKENASSDISAFMPPIYSVVGEPAIYAREH